MKDLTTTTIEAVSFAARSPEADAKIAALRARGRKPHAVLHHPDGWRTILIGDRPPIVVPPYVPRWVVPTKEDAGGTPCP